MPERLKFAIEEWKAADDAAREAEHRLTDAWNLYFRDGTPVPDALVDEVSAKRAEAARKLQAAVSANQGAVHPSS
jgi:hypothetical protein